MRYDKCNILPLSVFIDCIVDADFSGLSDDVSDNNEELWDTVYQEYTTLIESTKLQTYNVLVSELVALRCRLMVIESSVHILRRIPHPDTIQHLRDAGNDFPFDHENEEQYHKDLDRCLVRAKSIRLRIAQTEADIQALSAGEEAGKTTRMDFTQNIVGLSKFMGYPIREHETTVAKYAAIMNMYYAHIDALNSIDAKR
jgi:hypothetical protein